MSYASVAATNAPPPSEQPHANPALLNTDTPSADPLADDSAKVGVVPQGFKDHPATVTSEAEIIEQYPEPVVPDAPKPSQEKKDKFNAEVQDAKAKAKRTAQKAEAESFHILALFKEQLLRPGVAGGLIGVVNLGIIGSVGYAYYTHPHLRRDPKALGSTAAAAVALLSAEGYGAATYRATPRGQEEERRARSEGAAVYRSLKEHILRPGVLGGLIGLANVGVLGGVAYVGYTEWDRRTWDKRIVTGISVALLGLWGAEGYVAEQYREGKIQPPRP